MFEWLPEVVVRGPWDREPLYRLQELPWLRKGYLVKSREPSRMECLHRDDWKLCDRDGWSVLALGAHIRLTKAFYRFYWGATASHNGFVYTIVNQDFVTIDDWLSHMTSKRRNGYLNKDLFPNQLPWEIALLTDLTAQRAAAEAYWANHV